MTKRELLEWLAPYADDTPIMRVGGEHSTTDAAVEGIAMEERVAYEGEQYFSHPPLTPGQRYLLVI